MKKLCAMVLIAIACTQSAFSQGGTTLSIGAELLTTTGKSGDTWGIGIGGSAQGEHYFKDNISGLGYFGFNIFAGKTIPGSSNLKYKGMTIIPVRAGIRYYITEGFHTGAQLGVGFMSYGVSSTALAYSLQLGYNFNTKKGKAVDAALKYDGYSKSGGAFSALGIRLAYNLFSIR